ncbi:MAG: hypothetical protein WDA11_09590 [Thiohalomonadaceae bacterium]
MDRKPVRITFIILGISVMAAMIFYAALPTMGNVIGLEGIQAEDISNIKFIVTRERQEAWVLDDAKVIAETISYFNGLKAVPALRTGGGSLVSMDINLLEPTGSSENQIRITIFTERQYHGANGANYYALGKVKSSAQWEKILAMCSKSE